MLQHYVLDENRVAHATSLVNYVAWTRTIECQFDVGKDDLDDAHVSTVFLGLDHNWAFPGEPRALFETMIFGGEFDQWQRRYATWDEARAGHEDWVKRLQRGFSLDDGGDD